MVGSSLSARKTLRMVAWLRWTFRQESEGNPAILVLPACRARPVTMVRPQEYSQRAAIARIWGRFQTGVPQESLRIHRLSVRAPVEIQAQASFYKSPRKW